MGKLNVEVTTLVDGASQEEILIYEDWEMAERESKLAYDIELQNNMLSVEDDQERAKVTRQIIASLTQQHAQLVKTHSIMREARGKATTKTYALTKPTWGEWETAQGNAETVNTNMGTVSVNQRKMMMELMPKILTEHKGEDISRPVVLHLWSRITRIMQADGSKLLWDSFRSVGVDEQDQQ